MWPALALLGLVGTSYLGYQLRRASKALRASVQEVVRLRGRVTSWEKAARHWENHWRACDANRARCMELLSEMGDEPMQDFPRKTYGDN